VPRVLWAKFFKATTWKKGSILAKQDPIFAEAAKTIYRVTEDERVRYHCDAIERGERTHRTLVNQLNEQEQQIADKDAEIEKLRAEMEAREDYLRQQRTIQNRLERLNAALADTEQQLAAQHQKLNKLFVREPRAGSPFFTCQFC